MLHCCRRREHRRDQEKLRKVKTLGEAGEDVDDLGAWLNRSKKAEKKAREAERRKAEKLAKQLEEQVTTSLKRSWTSYSSGKCQGIACVWLPSGRTST